MDTHEQKIEVFYGNCSSDCFSKLAYREENISKQALTLSSMTTVNRNAFCSVWSSLITQTSMLDKGISRNVLSLLDIYHVHRYREYGRGTSNAQN